MYNFIDFNDISRIIKQDKIHLSVLNCLICLNKDLNDYIQKNNCFNDDSTSTVSICGGDGNCSVSVKEVCEDGFEVEVDVLFDTTNEYIGVSFKKYNTFIELIKSNCPEFISIYPSLFKYMDSKLFSGNVKLVTFVTKKMNRGKYIAFDINSDGPLESCNVIISVFVQESEK